MSSHDKLSTRPVSMGSNGMVTSAHPLASTAGIRILTQGGNAFDAGVAAVFTSMTSEFSLTGPGGGGIMLGMENGNLPVIYDFFVDCPRPLNNEIDFQKISVDFGNTTQDFHIGKGSTAIPGNIAGLLDVHSTKGSLPLDAILEPAIHFAKDGMSEYATLIDASESICIECNLID